MDLSRLHEAAGDWWLLKPSTGATKLEEIHLKNRHVSLLVAEHLPFLAGNLGSTYWHEQQSDDTTRHRYAMVTTLFGMMQRSEQQIAIFSEKRKEREEKVSYRIHALIMIYVVYFYRREHM